MELKPGELFIGEVDGKEALMYLSLITEEKGLERKDHCYRYAPPSHEIVMGKVVFKAKQEQSTTWRALRTQQEI